MTKTLILSHETVCQLLEAHASMAAWYYQLTDALREAGVQAQPPDVARTKAFLEQLATHYPEVAEVARSITEPRPYLPPPVFAAPAAPPPPPADGAVAAAPEAAREQPATPPPPPPVAPTDVPAVDPAQTPAEEEPPPHSVPSAEPVAPPPMVDPDKVRYD